MRPAVPAAEEDRRQVQSSLVFEPQTKKGTGRYHQRIAEQVKACNIYEIENNKINDHDLCFFFNQMQM